MSKILNAVKGKFNILKENPKLRYILISVLALILIVSVTLAWYINKVGLWGMEFNTGNIEFNTYVYSEDGTKLVGPVSSAEEDQSKYMNAPLMTLNNAQVGSSGTAYIVVESTGSLGMQYQIAFDIAGRSEKSTAYLGGYKYNISKVTDKVTFNGGNKMDVTRCPHPEKINDEIVTIDRNAVNGTIENKNGYDVYRIDYTLVQKNMEYTGAGINIYFNIFATQIGGDFEETSERGFTYYCSTKEDLDRACVEAYPGDLIRLTADIVYYGDLVFNKPVSLETNDHNLTVNGNLMYDYVLGNSLKLDAGGLGTITVQCTKEGVGGNFQIKAPIGDVTLVGANSANGDIIVEKNITIDATDAYGSAGVSFSEVRIVDLKNSRKTIFLESNTRATISFGTTIGLLQSVVRANNIEIVNNGTIGEINLSNMSVLPQTNTPQIYILNNSNINNPIMLPTWSTKFVEDASGKCTGNTKIIQSYSGSFTEVTGNCEFSTGDIQVEKKEYLVEQIEEGNDSRLKIYYQDANGKINTIQSILEDYLQYEATTDCMMNDILELEIISIGDKAVTGADIAFMNGNNMLALRQLDLQRANVYDEVKGISHKLPDNAFANVTKYQELVLPQNLKEIGSGAFSKSRINNIVMVPSGVTVFGANWFNGGKYVGFAASVPIAQAAENNGMTNVAAIFVEEAYIESYKAVYNEVNERFTTIIYPVSVLDETKEHFIRNTIGDEWEITYYISGEDDVIGKDITIDGEILTITSVYDNAYRHNYTGSTANFAETVTNVGAYNFYTNKNIREADLSKVKTLGASAFESCTTLSKVNFGDAMETIGSKAFLKCSSLQQDVVLPETMKEIGASAFQQSAIKSVYTGGATSVGGAVFSNCTSLVSADLPSATVVGDENTNQVFAGCSSLVSIKLPALITAHGERMFMNCNSIRELYMGANDDAVSLGTSPFTNKAKIKLYVPEEQLEFYRTKRPGNIDATMIYPAGEKLGEELVNGFNIGTYIVMDNGNNTYSLVTSNIEHSGTLQIPASFNEKPITHIYENAFRNQTFTGVTVKLGNNLKSVGDYSFYKLKGLVGVEFGNALEHIGQYSFSQCSNLKQDIILPASMRQIDAAAFQSSAITSVNTGGTTLIETGAFKSCTGITYVDMPEVIAVAESGTNEVFYGCTSLVRANMPKIERVSGRNMFYGCSAMLEFYMASNNPEANLGTNPFNQRAKLKLFVPAELVELYASKGILEAYQVFPQGEKIGDMTVNGVRVGDYVVMENEEGYTLVACNLTLSGDVTVPNTYNNKPITRIYANAFRNQTFTNTNLFLGDNIKVIGENAFNKRTGLKTIVMDGVTTIETRAFLGSGLTTLNGPKVTEIGDYAISTCTSLEMVNMQNLVTITGTFAFSDCTNLKSVYFENIMSVANTTFTNDKKLEKITINRMINADKSNMPSTMNINAAAPCKIYVPYRSLSAYGSTWSNKPVVSFDLSVTYNGDTFILSERSGKYFLIDYVPGKTVTALTLPATLTSSAGNLNIFSIEAGAFSAVSDTLKSLTLPGTIVQMGPSALSECYVLQNIYVGTNNKYFRSVNGILYTKDGKMLVKFPGGRVGKFDMTETSYASTLVIGSHAFENTVGLTEIVFPESLMVIDGTAFAGCSALKTVQFTGQKPPVLMGSDMFDTTVTDFKIVIPTTSSDVIAAYLYSYNFALYESYIDLNGNTVPSTSGDRNNVYLGN